MSRNRAALNFIFVTVLLDMIALGIIVPVLPRLVADFLHGNTARAAEVIGLFGTAWALMPIGEWRTTPSTSLFRPPSSSGTRHTACHRL